ncbi:hypothetical protein [Streptomyces sp. AD55]|uniref:hypothetical protein n=1 Tax=Streptomyces sp. AD55 TaxID=3242895 RepID=UPI0035285558
MAATDASPLPPASPARSPLARAEHFVWLTARVLEQRLFAHHFRGQGADPVETALDAYRNEDGGYGHALEPGLRGPASRPRHAARALAVLDAIGRCGGQRVERVCRYLTSVSTADGALPAGEHTGRVAPGSLGDLLATAPVVGQLHRNEVWHAWLFRATDFCWDAVESTEATHPREVEAALAFLDSAPDRPRARAAADRLGRLVRVRRLAVLEPDGRPARRALPGRVPGGRRFPHDYARTPGSLARAWFTDAEMARSLDALAAAQQEDGGWPVTDPLGSASADREARPGATLDALLTLRAHGRLPG